MPGTSEEQLTQEDSLRGLKELSENNSNVPAAEPSEKPAAYRASDLGSIRECQPPTGDGHFALLDPACSSDYQEQFRLLRTQLLLHRSRFNSDYDFRVVSVMSTHKGEGKSFTASNLASVLAVAGAQRVLLIDADPASRPVPIGIPIWAEAGLPQALSAPVDWAKAVYRVKGTPLYILGRNGSKPMNHLDLEPLPALLDTLREHFDWIILDGAAFASCPDASWLSAVTDGTLMVVRQNASSFGAVQEALAGVPPERMVGVVFNQRKSERKTVVRLRIKIGRKKAQQS